MRRCPRHQPTPPRRYLQTAVDLATFNLPAVVAVAVYWASGTDSGPSHGSRRFRVPWRGFQLSLLI
ncbi:hypothetical protein Acsp01_43020 [Actinoplanes sp. NBRC 101535]|nr:hypothetical protein Acsp01_43020 [Actinoplanes sp. NBRC 101535]